MSGAAGAALHRAGTALLSSSSFMPTTMSPHTGKGQRFRVWSSSEPAPVELRAPEHPLRHSLQHDLRNYGNRCAIERLSETVRYLSDSGMSLAEPS
jgi:hypothetical protein